LIDDGPYAWNICVVKDDANRTECSYRSANRCMIARHGAAKRRSYGVEYAACICATRQSRGDGPALSCEPLCYRAEDCRSPDTCFRDQRQLTAGPMQGFERIFYEGVATWWVRIGG